MLILTRKVGEGIVIAAAGGIEVYVVGMRSGRVSLGVRAPRAVSVLRMVDRAAILPADLAEAERQVEAIEAAGHD